MPMGQYPANLVVAPGSENVTFETLVKDTPRGLAVIGGDAYMDPQMLNGVGQGDIVAEIVDGKLGSVLTGAEFAFRAPDFWKKLVALGGPASAAMYGGGWDRDHGHSMSSVTAVPAKVTGVAVDVARGD